jgi:S1-C subfamily serine protease
MLAYFSRMPERKTLTLHSLSQEEKGQVVLQGFSSGIASEKAGLQRGDAILSLDQSPLINIEDVGIELLFKNRGVSSKIKILRQESTGADERMEFEATLQEEACFSSGLFILSGESLSGKMAVRFRSSSHGSHFSVEAI